MANQYFDLTSAEVEFIKLIAQKGVPTADSITRRLSESIGGANYTLPVYDATISAGVVTIPRVAQKFILRIDTEGQTNTDTITEFSEATASEWKTGDEIFIVLKSSARIVSIESGNNLVLPGDATTIGTDASMMSMVFIRESGASGEWIQKYITPNISENLTAGQFGFEVEALTIDTNEITCTKSFINLQSERTAETLASVSFQITAAGTDATFDVYIDEGNGQFNIASVSWVGTPLITTQLTDIVTAINGSGTGYTATDDGVDTFTIEAIPGSGSTPNASYESSVIATGGMTTATTTETFAGGVDGADQDDDLDTINSPQSNCFLWIRNIMTSNTITLKDGVDNISLGADFVLFPGEIVGLVVLSDVVRKVVCCKKKFKGTSWVDRNGDDSTAEQGLFNYPFKTISEAITASVGIGIMEVIIMSSGSIGLSDAYDETNILTESNLSLNFMPGAVISYTGNTDGGIFNDDSAIRTATLKFGTGSRNLIGETALNILIENQGSGGSNYCVFNITNVLAGTCFYVFGGRFGGQDRILNQSNNYIEFHDSHFFYSGANELIKLTGGTAVFKNCTFENFGDQIIPIINISGGKIILDNCKIHNGNNNASSHGITCSGGTIVFIGANRIVTTHGSSKSINCTANTDAKLMGQLYATHAIGGAGTITDLITGAALALTAQDADVE